jgi:hypothetical protein
MNAAQQQYRSCFAAFVQDLGELVDTAIRQAIAAELDRLAASENRKRKSVARAQSRRRAASADNGEPSPSRKPRGRAARKPAAPERSNGDEAPVQAAPQAPAPLFVHKRSRDGQIQRLSRSAGEEASRQTTAAG